MHTCVSRAQQTTPSWRMPFRHRCGDASSSEDFHYYHIVVSSSVSSISISIKSFVVVVVVVVVVSLLSPLLLLVAPGRPLPRAIAISIIFAMCLTMFI